MEKANRSEKYDRSKLKQYLFVIRELTSREIKRRYARSYLGILWSVLNPLLSMSVLSLIFSQIFRTQIDNFPIYYLSGYILWEMFMGATNSAMTSIADNRSMLIQVKFPMQIFVMARVYTALVNLMYSLIAYVIMLFVFQAHFSFAMFFAPVVFFFLLLFSLGMSYMLAVANVFFGDVQHLYQVFTMLWMYMSALFYPISSLEGVIYFIVRNNPIYNYAYCLRCLVLESHLPYWGDLLRIMIWGVGVFILGTLVFRGNKNKMMQKVVG